MAGEGRRVVVEVGGAEQAGGDSDGAGVALRTALIASAIDGHEGVAAGREASEVLQHVQSIGAGETRGGALALAAGAEALETAHGGEVGVIVI